MLPKLLCLLSAYLFINTIQAQPNLTVSFTSSPITTIKRGDYLTFSFKVKNIGNLIAQKSHVSVYLSPTQSLTGSTLLSEISTESLLNNSETQNMNYVFPVPYNLSNGNYYLILYPDSRREVVGNASNFIYSLNNTISINANGSQQNLPYPVILIHGLNSDNTAWYDFINDVQKFYGWSYGGAMNFCLNQNGNPNTSNYLYDYKDWSDSTNLGIADFYTINFNTTTAGQYVTSILEDVESDQSAVFKQGFAVRDAVRHVLNITGRDKVILLGHSMGGLAAREYIQNIENWQPDGRHHIAKLCTIGTPHGGSNFTGFGVGVFAGVDEHSEAVRDLRTSYFYSGDSGVYLFGGNENYSVMNDAIDDFNNVDVNCNGLDADNSNIIGLNQKSIYTNLAYSCIIGKYSVDNGDGVVSSYSANLNNFYNIFADTFNVNSFHTSETSNSNVIVKGLDEPGYTAQSFEINSDKTYFGIFTQQSLNLTDRTDYDTYKLSITSSQNLNFKIFNLVQSNCNLIVANSSLDIVYQYNTNGKGYLDFSLQLQPGLYYIQLSTIASANDYQYPYALKISYTDNKICPNNDVVFISNIQGTSYQWQVNNGSGYENINDNVFYSGYNTNSLIIKYPPTNWYGYKYRCLVNSTSISDESVLKFSVKWTGLIDDKWENPANWNCNILPDENTDVIISNGALYYPKISSNQSCRSLIVSNQGSVIALNGSQLTITGK